MSSSSGIKVTISAKDNVAKALGRKAGIVEVCTAGHALYKGDPEIEKFYYSVGFDQAEKKLGVKLDRRASYLIHGKAISKMRKTKKGRVLIGNPINVIRIEEAHGYVR